MKPIFVDGTNLLVQQEKLFGPTRYLSFSSLMKFLKERFEVDYCYFYASFNPEPSLSDPARVGQYKMELKFFNDAKSVSNLKFVKGHRSKTSGKEKGVDVKLSVDLATMSCEEQFEEAFIMTGDADFDYAVEKSKSYGVKVNIITLANMVPLGIAARVDKTYILDFEKYFFTSVQPNIQRPPKSLEVVDATPYVDLLE